MKLIIFNDCIGHIARIGLYSNDDKWIKWIPKKELDRYVEECDTIENKNL